MIVAGGHLASSHTAKVATSQNQHYGENETKIGIMHRLGKVMRNTQNETPLKKESGG